MPCFFPLIAWRAKAGHGLHPIVFKEALGYPNTKMQLPCGQCIGCRLDHARKWAVRCMHEASLYPSNVMVTLTYDTDKLPKDGSLDKSHFVLFMKKLRKKYGAGIRFFHCGEYGDLLQRPHHHVVLFNHDFSDRYLWERKGDKEYFRSTELEKLWTYGFSQIVVLDVNNRYDVACYVARYILKKVNGDESEEHYDGKQKEYVTMSRRPGIGKEWYEKFKSDLYNHDKCVVRDNFILKPPRYYDNLYMIENPEDMLAKKVDRKKKAMLRPDNSVERLTDRARSAKVKQERYQREFATF